MRQNATGGWTADSSTHRSILLHALSAAVVKWWCWGGAVQVVVEENLFACIATGPINGIFLSIAHRTSISLSFSLFLSLPFFIFRRSLELILLLDDIFY